MVCALDMVPMTDDLARRLALEGVPKVDGKAPLRNLRMERHGYRRDIVEWMEQSMCTVLELRRIWLSGVHGETTYMLVMQHCPPERSNIEITKLSNNSGLLTRRCQRMIMYVTEPMFPI
jgi:hypothetical protein